MGDVGESKYVDPCKLYKSARLVGTPLYLSPEIIKAQQYDQRVDIWAIGCALYELLTLNSPFKGSNLTTLTHSILTTEPEPIPRYHIVIFSCYSSTMHKLVEKLLKKDITHRPFIDEVISYSPFKTNKLSPVDFNNLGQYKELKHQFKMRDLKQPSSTYQLLVQQLQKNIMKGLKADNYNIPAMELKEEAKEEKRKIMQKKMWYNKLVNRDEQRLYTTKAKYYSSKKPKEHNAIKKPEEKIMLKPIIVIYIKIF